MAQPNIIRRDKASSHPRERGRFYNGTVISSRPDGRITVRIPSLNVTYGPIMPLNTTDANRYVKNDNVLCGFTDENNSQLVVFGSLSPKYDVFATAENGISIYENISARDTAISSPNEGRVVYILDTDELQIFNGSEWITVVDTGNSENITASTIVATSASIGTLTVTGESTLNVLGYSNLTASTSIGNVSPTEISYLDGVTSAIQTQLNSKSTIASPTFTGTATIPTLSVTGNTTIGGNLTVNGTTITVNSSVTTIDDPVITLGGDTAPTSDDNKDRGIEFRYYSGTAASVGFFGYDDSTQRFTFLTGATNSSEIFSGTPGVIDIGSIITRQSSGQDGIILQGRSGGSSSYSVTVTPTTLTGNKTLTIPDTSGTIITTGDSGTVSNQMLATISASGKVSNAATTATSANTPTAIVSRDGSGNFSAGIITATLNGAAPSSQLTGQTGMWTSVNRPGPYRLYRNDDNSAYNVQTTWDGTRWLLRGYLNDTYHAPCRVDYSDSSGNANTAGGLSVHGGRNNEANKIVRTQVNGYILCGYINSDSGYNENNNSSPDRVWGSNAGGDAYLRTYRTSALSVNYANSAGSAPANGGNSSTVGGYGVSLEATAATVAVRNGGDGVLKSNYFLGVGTVGVATGNSDNLRRRSADGYFLIEGSRINYKRDIEYINWDDSREILLSLKPAKFNWKDEFNGPAHQNPLMQQINVNNKEYGFIVEDVAEASRELVTYLDDNDEKIPTPMMWQQNGVISILVKVVQELINKVEDLETINQGTN